MAYDHLNHGIDKYALFIDNQSQEDELNDTDISTASDFAVSLNPQLDLSSLLFLRSVQAEIGVSSFFIDSLPLCCIRQESVHVHFNMPLNTVEANEKFNRSAMEKLNDTPLQLEMDDYCCSENQLAIDYVNSILHYSVNHYILYRYLISSMDTNIFKRDYMHVLSVTDCRLINQYLNMAMVCRKSSSRKSLSFT